MTKVYKYYLTENSASLLSSYSLSKSDISKVAKSVAPFPATLMTFGYLCAMISQGIKLCLQSKD